MVFFCSMIFLPLKEIYDKEIYDKEIYENILR